MIAVSVFMPTSDKEIQGSILTDLLNNDFGNINRSSNFFPFNSADSVILKKKTNKREIRW